jgi:multidrug efflux pump subunit AcrB
LFRSVVARPIALGVVIVTFVVVGLISYARIPLQMMPDGFSEPGLQIWASNPGASAQENEEKLTRPLEEQLRTLAGVQEIRSGSNEDDVWISVEFDASVDMDLAKAEVRDRVERARPLLPTSVRDIGIWSWSNAELPVMFFSVLHPGDSAETDFLLEEVVQRKLEAVDGVSRVELWGVLDDSLRILLDEDRVRAAGLDLGALIARLSQDNFALPMGEVTDGSQRLMLRSDMRFTEPEQIESYPVGNGLRLGDLARVAKVKSVRDRLFKIDGSHAYFGEIQKDTQANVVATSQRLRAAFRELERDPRLAGRFSFLPLFDQGIFIENSLAALESTAIVGGLLSILVLYLFLWRARLTLVVAFSIPLSILFALTWIYLGGGTFNVLTMTGITLATGMLVDNAVVVVENISRKRQEGYDPRTAAAEGAREVALAVALSTLTTVVVFAPLIFMTENPVMRIIFGAIGVPLCVSLLFSLVAALLVLPAMAARLMLGRPRAMQWLGARLAPLGVGLTRAVAALVGGLGWLGGVSLAGLGRLARGAVRLLTPIRFPLIALAVGLAVWRAKLALPTIELGERARELGLPSTPPKSALVVLAGSLALIAFVMLVKLPRWRSSPPPSARPTRVVRPAGRSLMELLVSGNSALLGWTLANRGKAAALFSAIFASVAVPMNLMTITSFGQDENTSRLDVQVRLESNFTLLEAEQEMAYYECFFGERKQDWGFDHTGVRFDELGGRASLYWDEPCPREKYDQVVKALREGLRPPPGHKIFLYDADNRQVAERSKTLVSFELTGPDSDELERWGLLARAGLEKIEGLSGVTTPLENAPGQVRVRFDSDKAQSLGVTPENAFQSIAWALRGWQLPRFQEPGREIPLLIEYDDEQVAGLDTLRDLQIFTENSPVPLASVADLNFASGAKSIYRRNGQVTFTLTAKVEDAARQRELSQAGYAALRQLDLPRGISLGQTDLVSQRQDQELREIKSAFLLSLVLVFLLMGVLFESFVLPVSVLFTIPLAISGALWTLFLTGTNMDSVGWIGMIILAGVVVNNGIVLIDRIHGLRAQEGLERDRAVILGTAQRVRAVLMTALTTILGLIPMAMTEPPADAIDYRALATCVAGGLAVSTVFTLWAVPLAYTLIDDFAVWFGGLVRWSLRPREWRAARAAALPRK